MPDGSCDITAHVAIDAVARPATVAGAPYTLITQRAGAAQRSASTARRPPLDLARTDPAGYVRALAARRPRRPS